MSTINELLNNSNTITITLASLGNGSFRASTAIDNTTNQDLDAGVQLVIKTGASGVSSTGFVNIWAYGSADGGTTYSDGVTGTDAALTPTSPTNLVLIDRISAVANATTYKSKLCNVAKAFGYLPGKWGIVVENETGAALDATEANFTKVYERVRGTSA